MPMTADLIDFSERPIALLNDFRFLGDYLAMEVTGLGALDKDHMI